MSADYKAVSYTHLKLIKNKRVLFEKFTELCDDYYFQNAIRAADKTSINTRINNVEKIVNIVLEMGDTD